MDRAIDENRMGKTKSKKEISLNVFLLRFLLEIAFALVVAVALWIFLILILTQSKQIVGASVVEKNVENWISMIEPEDVVKEKSIPDYTKYAIFSKDGVCLCSNYKKAEMENVIQFARSDSMTNQAGVGQRITRKVITNTQTIIITYEIKAFLINPVTGEYMFGIESILIIAFIALLFIAISYVLFRNGKKLQQKVVMMQDVAIQIGKQDLNVTIQNTGIKELNQVMNSLGTLSVELGKTLQEKWMLEQRKKQQLASLAHDIKTPLTILQGNLELLEESSLNEEQRSYLDYMRQNEEKIHEYVLKMLEVSRNKEEINACEIQTLWPDFQKNIQNLGLQKDLQWEFHIDESICMLPISWQELQRILSNIIENAVTYSPNMGKITCILEKQTDIKNEQEKKTLAIFNITDEGPGFLTKDLKYATEEFYQSDESRHNKEHFGMGLTIAEELIKKNGGRLIIQNRIPHGANIIVELPLV